MSDGTVRTLGYFAKDGNYGDASGMMVLETTHWSDLDWQILDAAKDEDRPVVARLLTESYEPERDDDFIRAQLASYGLEHLLGG